MLLPQPRKVTCKVCLGTKRAYIIDRRTVARTKNPKVLRLPCVACGGRGYTLEGE